MGGWVGAGSGGGVERGGVFNYSQLATPIRIIDSSNDSYSFFGISIKCVLSGARCSMRIFMSCALLVLALNLPSSALSLMAARSREVSQSRIQSAEEATSK